MQCTKTAWLPKINAMKTINEPTKQSEDLQKLTDSSVSNTGEPLNDVEILEQLSRKHPMQNNSRQERNRCDNRIIEDAIEHPSISEINKTGLRNQ